MRLHYKDELQLRIAVYGTNRCSEHNTKLIKTLCDENVELRVLKTSGTPTITTGVLRVKNPVVTA
jgi:hypothetical protein